MSVIAELAEERVVEGVYAVARKQRLRTKGGAPYLALELVDPSGRIDARVWHDVELLDARFAEGDAVRVLGRVEKFRDRLQVDVRTLEAAPEADPAEFAPALRRDADELDGFLEFLAGEIVARRARATVVTRFFSDDAMRALAAAACLPRRPPLLRGRAARAHGRRGDDLPRDGAAPSAASRRTCCSPRRSSTTSAAYAELDSRPDVPTDRRGSPARARPSRAAHWSRSAQRAPARRSACRAAARDRRVITTRAPRARPRRPSCTTRTSSTRSPRRAQFRD